VYDDAKKAFVGIVHVFDVLCDRAPEGKKVADYMRPPQFVSHQTLADHVLPRMRVTRQPLVMVLDDRYEFVGIVTIEDVLEEVVGQL
jgi:CBS domain containing-hemolysin-like protein